MAAYIRKHQMIQDWTPDEIAECIPYQDDKAHSIYVMLWQNLENKRFWSKLTNDQKRAINAGAAKEWKSWRK